jgi:hypothetical protein
MATVYLARQETLDRDVALKELSTFHASEPDMAARFLRESQLAGSLNHPNIVTVHEYFEHGGVPYIAMEYLERGSLRPYVGHLSFAQLVGVMEGVLAGLAHAETVGIVHRDMKPENLMATADGRVKIADFGIAKATQSAGAGAFLTATGTTVGTPSYMAPEQAMGQDVGIWTDLYSVGVMAWEHLVGRVPFHDSDAPMVILMRHVNEQIAPPDTVNPQVDPDVSAWVSRLLIKDPVERTRSPAGAWEELEEIVIRMLGPRWRREARLPSHTVVLDTPRPLTPAPFESQKARTPEPLPAEVAQPVRPESGYITFGPAGEVAAPAVDAEHAPGVAAPAVDAEHAPGEAASAVEAEQAPGVAASAVEAEQAPEIAASAATVTPPPIEAEPPPAVPVGDPPAVPHEPTYVTFGAAPAKLPTPAEPEQPRSDDDLAQPVPAAAAAPVLAEETIAPASVTSDDGLVAAESVDAPAVAVPEIEAGGVAEVAALDAELGEVPEVAAPETEAGEGPEVAGLEVEPVAGSEVEEPAVAEVPATAPSPARPATRRTPIRAGAAALAMAGVLCAAAIGFVVAPTSTNSPSTGASAASRAAEPPFSVSYPATWQRQAGSSVAQLPLSSKLAIGPVHPAGSGAMTIGMATTTDPSLLPSALISALGNRPSPQVVTLGGNQFYRYLDLNLPGTAGPETVYALPTTAGTLIATCPTGGAAGFAEQCENVLGTLRLSGGRVIGLGPNATFAAGLTPIVTRLGSLARQRQAQLSQAKTPAGQASAAAALAEAYGRAASAVAQLHPGPAAATATAALVSALRSSANGYSALGRAATRQDKQAYDSARSSITSAAAAITAAFGKLSALGYVGQ